MVVISNFLNCWNSDIYSFWLMLHYCNKTSIGINWLLRIVIIFCNINWQLNKQVIIFSWETLILWWVPLWISYRNRKEMSSLKGVCGEINPFFHPWLCKPQRHLKEFCLGKTMTHLKIVWYKPSFLFGEHKCQGMRLHLAICFVAALEFVKIIGPLRWCSWLYCS